MQSKLVISALVSFSLAFAATNTVHGIVYDPQHRPVEGAHVTIRGLNLPSPRTASSGPNGDFEFNDVPEGSYTLSATAPGFGPLEQRIDVTVGRTPVLHLQLEIQAVKESVEVSGAVSRLDAEPSTVQTSVVRHEIQQSPGADLTNSLSMITDYTPGAYMVHDMLHMRGGHQVNWFFDGIPVINTNIAANVAPLINPKNVEELEVERGGFSSQYGDRTYGFFNVVTPSGFESDQQAELVASGGNFNATDDQISFASHTERFAYYASADGNRSDLGLGNPTPAVIHDQESGLGGFLSLLYNPAPKDQLRWIASVREDHYQVPNTADDQAAGIRDLDVEQDYIAGFSWTHTLSDGLSFNLAPYFHFNGAHYIGCPGDVPFILDDNNRATYIGARSVFQAQKKRHNARAGIEVWGQRSSAIFGLTANPGGQVLQQTERHWANSDALFLEDQYKVTSWLTLGLGLRLTHYQGLVSENAADPRLGGAIRLPRLHWILRGYYAYYYQPPPLDSLSGPLLNFAVAQGFGFIPLPGERDIQRDIGLTVPIRDWAIEVDDFHTSARNFLDHDVIGNSGIFIPLTDLGAIISGTEVTVRSPRLFKIAQWRVAYSNQIAQGIGPITGGLIEFAPTGNFLLDHDQRNTVSSVLSLALPGRIYATPAYQFGSGFLNGDGPAHLPPHSTFDLAIGKRFGENWSASVNAINIANTRYLLDTSNTFGGTHTINPRQIYGELRYRFHF
ncbi:MAG: TonB-dependent receptor [Bryobacteraceae bacterium]|jgi:outer membrane receptor protein involved in Fe transport/predicted small secreted protein